MSSANRNRGNSRKSRLNKTGGSDFIGFSSFQKAKSTTTPLQQNGNNPQTQLARKIPKSSRLVPSPVFTVASNPSSHVTEITTLFKKIGRKRDSTTRSKALSDLCLLAFPSQDNQTNIRLTKPEMIATLSHLTFLFYTKLAHDNDRTVRATVLHCLVEAKSAVPKAWYNLMQHPCNNDKIQCSTNVVEQSEGSDIAVPSVLGIIWCLQSDPASEVQREARACLRDINSDKPANAKDDLANFNVEPNDLLSGILAYILSTLKHTRPSSLAEVYSSKLKNQSNFIEKGKKKTNKNMSETMTTEDDKKEEEERFERTLVSTMKGLQMFITSFLHHDVANDSTSILKSFLITNGKTIWKHLLSSRAAFRRETFQLLSRLAQPQLQAKKESGKMSTPLSVIILHQTVTSEAHIYPALSMETNPSNIPVLIEAILLFLSTFSPNEQDTSYRWKVTDCQILCKHFSKILRKACHGAPADSWAPSILPFLHLLPSTNAKEGLLLPCQLIASLWEGKVSSSLRINDEIAIVTGVAECSGFLLLKTQKWGNASNSVNELKPFARELIDYFNSALLFYMQCSNGGHKHLTRRKSSKIEENLLHCLTNDLHKFDVICQKEEMEATNIALIYTAKNYIFETTHAVTEHESMNGSGVISKSIAMFGIDAQYAGKLMNFLKVLGEIVVSNQKKESFEESETLVNISSPLYSSLLVSSFRLVVKNITSRSRRNEVSEDEIELLQCILKLAGVKNVLPSTIPSANIYLTEETKTENAQATSATIEYFCMNDLLKLVIAQGYVNNQSNTNNTVIKATFEMLRLCLEATKSPIQQKKLWESFLNELIVAKCPLAVLSAGLSILAKEPIKGILRCKVLEDFAIRVGNGSAYTVSDEVNEEKLCENHSNFDDYDNDNNDEQRMNFFRSCVGLKENNHLLVGPRVISRWMEFVCNEGRVLERVQGEYSSHVLLETLIALSSKVITNPNSSISFISEKEISALLVEAWYQNTRTWEIEALPLLNSTKSEESLVSPSQIRDRVIEDCSLILKQELLQPSPLERHVNEKDSFEKKSLKWTHRAQRLMYLWDREETHKASLDTLNLVGLSSNDLWISEGYKGSEWAFWCLFHFLFCFNETNRKDLFLVGNAGECASLFIKILLSIAAQSQADLISMFFLKKDPVSERCQLLIKTIFGEHFEESKRYEDFLESCAILLVESISNSLSDNEQNLVEDNIPGKVLVLDVVAANLLGEAQSLVVKEMRKGDEIVASDIKVGDVLWYEQKMHTDIDSEKVAKSQKRVEAKVLKIHTDDYPNLYFTIEIFGNTGTFERQTVASRLKTRQEKMNDSEPKLDHTAKQRTNDIEIRARKLEQIIFDRIVKRVFDRQEIEESYIFYAAANCLNLILLRCGLQGAVGIGSLRYGIFQLISQLDGRIAASISASEVNEKTVKTLQCISYAMIGNKNPGSSNFEALNMKSIKSLETISNFYESANGLQSISKDIETKFHSAVLLWLSIATVSVTDFKILPRINNVLNKAAIFVLKNYQQEFENVLFDSLSIMRTIEIIQNRRATLESVEEDRCDPLTYICVEELIRAFASAWVDEEQHCFSASLKELGVQSRPVWFDQFSWLLSTSHTELNYDLQIGAMKVANDICTTLFSPTKKFFGFYLLRMVASQTSKDHFDDGTNFTSRTNNLLKVSTQNMTEDERLELEEDFLIASKWLPGHMMNGLAQWNDPSDFPGLSEDAIFGQLLTWLLLLDFLERAGNFDSRNRSAISSFIQVSNVVNTILKIALSLASLKEKPSEKFIVEGTPKTLSIIPMDEVMSKVANLVVFRTAQILPTLTKSWWNDYCPRSEQGLFKIFVETHVAPEILKRELVRIDKAMNLGEMLVNGSCVSREIVATYVQDECQLSVMVRVPQSFPLRNVEVDCRKTKGIAENRWRRWSLQIMRMLNSQDGTVLDALLLWKSNVDKEFEGVEPCPVCYSVLCVKTHAMPNLECKTCHNRFHSTCLYKWFQSSGKSQCVLCQQPWSGRKV